MSSGRLLLLVIAYLAFDLVDPVLPGAFSVEVRDGGAVYVQRRSQDKATFAVRSAPRDRRVERRSDAFILQRSAVTAPPLRDVVPRRPAPREARQAPAQSLDDH